MMAPVRIQHMLRFGNDILIKIAYIFCFFFSEFNLHVSYYKARYPM